MSVIFLLIPLSIVIAACFLGAFFWAVRSGQYEDTCTPSMRVLLDDAPMKRIELCAPEQGLLTPATPKILQSTHS
jgi:cbb3-type cytochrome oxidase maturation protein